MNIPECYKWSKESGNQHFATNKILYLYHNIATLDMCTKLVQIKGGGRGRDKLLVWVYLKTSMMDFPLLIFVCVNTEDINRVESILNHLNNKLDLVGLYRVLSDAK